MAARRVYISTAHDHSMLTGAVLQGLGNDGHIIQKWPRGRSYHDIATFRAPYTSGMYAPGNPPLLGLGLGAPPASITSSLDASAPPEVKRYLLSGEPVSQLANNVSLPLNQVPRLAYGIIALAATALSYYSYKRFKKLHPST